ncbi:pyridoxal phosphate-dependent aminotransferase [Ferroacidibacillus organovorans]|uniref:Aminotransferase class I/classII large domain-containing protein n=1 Tax=Ferroacidibacillus organovorans TaxID=1765683 RepID=A0A1V4EU36_9BACL|nr:aminotransferase class I/II-fold pyridoxal phosphate-dependent enzyme [Ferroacidibacillus organovorans]OPG16372.1 hypothetical protein B2M26_05690 [Ferroacidibacillus organovorans]
MHGGKVYEYAEQRGGALDEIVDFSANLHPLGPPETVTHALQVALHLVRHYPDSRHLRVKEVLAKRYDVAMDHLVCGNGASEVLELLLRVLAPQRTWIMEPAFREYEAIARRVGSQIEHVSMMAFGDRFYFPLNRIVESARTGDCVVLNTPHNPSGMHVLKVDVSDAVNTLLDHNVDVIVDESFIDFLENEKSETWLRESTVNPHLHTIRSATKVFAIPGLRFGFAVVHPDVAKKIESDRDGWSVNVLAQEAAIAAYQDRAWILRTQQWLVQQHAFIHSSWGMDARIHVYPFAVNFFLVTFSHASLSRFIQTELHRSGYIVRNCESFHGLGASHMRIAIRTAEENYALWNAYLNAMDAYQDHSPMSSSKRRGESAHTVDDGDHKK